MSVSPLERRLAPNPNHNLSGCIGCLVCPRQVKIEVDINTRTELDSVSEGVAPVHIQGDYGQSECGLDAIHGVCKYEGGVQELADFIANDGIDGVRIISTQS